MANQKSTTLIALGLAVFVIGGALLLLVVRHDGKSSPKHASTLSAAVTTTTLAPGTAVYRESPPTTTIQFKIPDGDNAVAVQMDYFGGGGGDVRQGDSVNIYAIANKGCGGATGTNQAVKLILTNVQVLEALGTGPAATGTPGSYLLALTPQQAELLIYHQAFNKLYFSLTAAGAPAATTTGVTCANSL